MLIALRACEKSWSLLASSSLLRSCSKTQRFISSLDMSISLARHACRRRCETISPPPFVFRYTYIVSTAMAEHVRGGCVALVSGLAKPLHRRRLVHRHTFTAFMGGCSTITFLQPDPFALCRISWQGLDN